MTIVFYISGHGFGHASRDLEVMHAIAARQPDVRLIARTSVPPTFFEVSARARVEVHAAATDTGVVQIDTVRIDEAATVRDASAFYGDFERRAEAEARVLDQLGADLVVGDAPPLAFTAADLAGVPSVLLANFTWDWIYQGYEGFSASPVPVLDTMRDAYSRASHVLRLPFHGGFETVRPAITDIPLIARQSRRNPEDTRRVLGISGRRPVVLSSFSRYGMALPYDRLVEDGRLTLVVTDHERSATQRTASSAMRHIGRQDLTDLHLRYEDLVAAADVVVSKPGYGIVSECIANRAAFLYTPRERFVEHDILEREMPRFLRCRRFDEGELAGGRWFAAVERLLGQPAPSAQISLDGAGRAAEILVGAARHESSTNQSGAV
ncbi:MAG: hypothetical protein AB7P22_12285 [Vicinamibacterales bacterium]